MGTCCITTVYKDGEPVLGTWQNMDGYPAGWDVLLPRDNEPSGWQNCYASYEYRIDIPTEGEPTLTIKYPEGRHGHCGKVLWQGTVEEFREDPDTIIESISGE